MSIHNRSQLFVDRKVQGELMQRTVMYWFFWLLALSLMVFCWRILTYPVQLSTTHFREMWQFYGPTFMASLILLPIVVVDVIRFSNRFAGPAHRLRREMHRLAHGERARAVVFRENDHWTEFADDFNKILARLQPAAKPNQATEDTLAMEDTINSESVQPLRATCQPDEKQFAEPFTSLE